MATSNNALKVTDLDYFGIRNNLKEFLRNQNEFSDYDFDGSGMGVLLDLLAYNTYYNSFYLNMVANESFLDTAQVRQNILSHAKVINYVPTSNRGSLSKINILVTPSNTEDQATNYIVLDKYTRLVGEDIDGTSYPFVTINSNSSAKVNGTFSFSNVFIKQGEVITLQYNMSANNFQRRFDIPSKNVDTSTITVTVQESASNTYTTEYQYFNDITDVSGNTAAYFIEENVDENYTIYFGDDVVGRRPANGNIVVVTYLDSVGSVANNISNFTFTDSVGGLYKSNVIISTLQTSYGGTDKETIEQIRFRAPYHYTVQNRAVTENDYESLITKDYNNIDSVSVWGGETNDPPEYGKVYLSLKTKGFYSLTELEKEQIKSNLIGTRNVMTVIPEIVDPDYVYVLLRGNITYNPTLTSKSSAQLLQLIRNAIFTYATNELNTFKSTFRKSKLQAYIENVDPSITGSDITVYLQKQVNMELNVNRNYTIRFNTGLRKGDLQEKLYTFPQLTVLDTESVTRNVFIEEVPASYTGIRSVTVQSPGSGFTSAPTVTISGDGIGATAEATVVNGRIENITLTNKGSNYTRATVTLTGGGGTGATAFPVVETEYGDLRTFYYRSNGEKVVVNPNAGTINYRTGEIELVQMNPSNVVQNAFYPNEILTLNTVSLDEIIPPKKNRILVIDNNDDKAIQLEVTPET